MGMGPGKAFCRLFAAAASCCWCAQGILKLFLFRVYKYVGVVVIMRPLTTPFPMPAS